jgi:predicted ATPase
MKRILVTGMSGAGKSTLIGALVAHGYPAVDGIDVCTSHNAAGGKA